MKASLPDIADYPLEQISMGSLGYRWIDDTRFSPDKCKVWLEHYALWESYLHDPNWSPAVWKEQVLLNTYQDVCEHAKHDQNKHGLKNCLNVGRVGNMYAVLRGNMRFCILRVRGYTGKVPCRVAKVDDIWGDMTASYMADPYDKNVNYKQLQETFQPKS